MDYRIIGKSPVVGRFTAGEFPATDDEAARTFLENDPETRRMSGFSFTLLRIDQREKTTEIGVHDVPAVPTAQAQ